MDDYLRDFLKASSELYEHLIRKAVDGGSLTDNELLFIMQHEKRIVKYSKTPLFKQIISGIKDVSEFLKSNDINLIEGDTDDGV